ncbi:MAG: excinuclease ABC subunit UvrC, partial [Campylobacteraceae bacterium]|nr:excinuclease ABC subunit UvrC [Campylobacteraceae bacterium]
DAIYMIFPLVQKNGCLKEKKACLFYQINRCLAPCEKKISQDDYLKIVNSAISLINDRKQIVKLLEDKMDKAAKLLNFEEAGHLRDMQISIKNTLYTNQIDIAKLEDFDIFAVYFEENIACGLRLFMRDGKVVSSTHTIINSQNGFDKDELYIRLLFEYYTLETPHLAKNILIADSIDDIKDIEIALSKKCNFKFHLQHPKIGEKKHLCELAIKNAKELIKQEKNRKNINILNAIYELCELENRPFAIEIFDNSHIGGEANVGAQVVWENDKFIKSRYRHCHLNANSEYLQMKELLINRSIRFEKEAAPELWLIDGGETLRKLAEDIIESSGANVDVIAIAKEKIDAKAHRAKGGAKDIIYTKKGKIVLATTDERLQFLQYLRDEAHRFAISFHRKTKRKMVTQSSHLKSAGLSDGVIKKLLDFYGSFEEIKKADTTTLNKLFSKQIANKISDIINTILKNN